jgi:hypothetical protein
MPDLFKEIIPSILQTGKSVIHDDIDLKDYKAFMVNRSLSYHLDCVPYVNELNRWPDIDSDMQYQYLLNTIRPMKRKFQPWQKPKKDEDIDCVKTYFGYSNEKARQALRILTDEQIAEIRKRTDKGG